MHRIPWEFPEFYMFREIPEYSSGHPAWALLSDMGVLQGVSIACYAEPCVSYGRDICLFVTRWQERRSRQPPNSSKELKAYSSAALWSKWNIKLFDVPMALTTAFWNCCSTRTSWSELMLSWDTAALSTQSWEDLMRDERQAADWLLTDVRKCRNRELNTSSTDGPVTIIHTHTFCNEWH